MYRKAGSAGVLKGVLSGPYAGAARHVDAAKLSRATRTRLVEVLSGRGQPKAIAVDGAGRRSSRVGGALGMLAALLVLVSLVTIGFADPYAAWAYQPAPVMIAYVAATTLLAVSLLVLLRRRAHAPGSALLPGRYLLPLDIVDVPAPDANADQVLTVTPLGGARDASIRVRGKKTELVITLDRGEEHGFALRGEHAADQALRRLEHAQTMLEELTYARDLEKQLANDPFFDVRADDSWSSVAPSGPSSTKARGRRRLLQGTAATAASLALGAALGVALFTARSWASDRGLFLRALHIGTDDALDAYLVRATSHRGEAADLRERLKALHAADARLAAQLRTRPGFEGTPRAEWELTPEEAATRSGTVAQCTAALRAHASTTHPQATPLIEDLVLRAGRSGDNVIPVRVTVEETVRPSTMEALDVEKRADTTIVAFERILSETCPATLVKLARRPAAPAGVPAPGIDIKVSIAWPVAPTWQLPLVYHAPAFAFDVTLRGADPREAFSFRLNMPPPAERPVAVRPRSLFVVPAASADDVTRTTHRLLTARAFDRLYDEIYGLFFTGDPRVPLHEDDAPDLAGPGR